MNEIQIKPQHRAAPLTGEKSISIRYRVLKRDIPARGSGVSWGEEKCLGLPWPLKELLFGVASRQVRGHGGQARPHDRPNTGGLRDVERDRWRGSLPNCIVSTYTAQQSSCKTRADSESSRLCGMADFPFSITKYGSGGLDGNTCPSWACSERGHW